MTLAEVAVVIPARNEARTLPACLASIRAAAQRLTCTYPGMRARLIVVLDRCTDDSTAVLRACSRGMRAEVVPSSAGTAGGARALGAARALGGTPAPAHRLWLANTDADSTVPPDWLTRMAEFAASGAQVVLGTVHPDERLAAGTRRRWQSLHDPVEEHRHVHGANFGIRGDAYRRLGGWTPIASGEDVALARRAERAGLSIRRTAAIPVTTSSRLVGRAPGGFADYLAALSEPGELSA